MTGDRSIRDEAGNRNVPERQTNDEGSLSAHSKMDLTFRTVHGRFNYRVGAIILHKGKLLLMRNTEAPYIYSVGGRVHYDESTEEAVIRAFRLLQERRFKTSSSMCLHRHNIGVMKETVDLLGSLGVEFMKMNVAYPTGRWKKETEHFLSHDEAYSAILEYLPQYVADGMPVSVQFSGILAFDKQDRSIRIPYVKFSGREGAEQRSACRSARSSMYISPAGRILPCMTLGGTAIDPMFESVLEKPLAEILSKSHYRDMCRLSMGECIGHNEKCRSCSYRLYCGAGCRAKACGETSTDYLGVDEETCHFFKNGWFEKAREAREKYLDSFR